MSRFSVVLSCIFVAVLLGAVQVLPASALSSEQIVAKTKDSVVRILVQVEPGDREVINHYNLPDLSRTVRFQAGTGFVVTNKGFIVTSSLVLPPSYDKKNIFVRLPKEGDQLVKVVSVDPDRRIACLKIEKFDLVPLALSSNAPKVGTDVFALGFPYAAVTSEISDQEPTFTEGKVGALKQTRQESTLIQTNAAVNTGSSGGPLLDTEGNVIGVILGSVAKNRTNRSINKSLEGMLPEGEIPVGIAFATPSKLLLDMLIAAGVEAAVAVPPPVPVKPPTNPGGAGKDEQKIQAGGPGTPTDPPLVAAENAPYLIAAIVMLILVITGILLISNSRRAVAQQSSPEVPIQPQPTFAKSTTVSLGTLRCTEGEYAGKTFSMTEKGLVFGRDNECDIRFSSEIISRRHSWIGPRNGEITVRDMGSTNGTFVNGKKVEGTMPLQKGDVVSLSKSGQETFQFAD